MNPLEIKSDPRVKVVFDNYPNKIRGRILELRRLVIEAATEKEEISILEETLKWGEPSYLTKHGSTIRMDWKAKNPDQYAIYFKCTSQLVPSFKAVYNNLFNYEGNRAIVFKLNDEIPKKELKACIKAGLYYHKLKKLPLLGL